MAGATDPSRRHGQREYKRETFAVSWEPGICIHSARCIRTLPDVFNARARPWVDLDGATPEEIEAAIATCPSAALKFRWLNKDPGS